MFEGRNTTGNKEQRFVKVWRKNMFCKNCGKEIQQAKFCKYCGENQTDDVKKILGIEQNEYSVEDVQSNKKVSKETKGIIFAFVGGGIVLCLLIGMFWILGRSKSDTFLKLLATGKVEEAREFYDNKLEGDASERSRAYEACIKEINDIVSKYYSNSVSYEDAMNKLEVYSEFYAEKAEEAKVKINGLKDSHEAYQAAEEAYAEKNYQKAYELYQRVITDDDNYENAQDKKGDCYNVIYQQMMDTATSKAAEGDNLGAVNYLNEQMDILNADEKANVIDVIQGYKQQYVEQQWEKIKTEEDFDKKYTSISELESVVGSMEILRNLQNELNAAYEDYVIKQVDIALEARNPETAMQLIYAAEKHIPGDIKIQKLKESIKDYNPVAILDLEPYAIGQFGLGSDTAIKDNMGNTYETALTGYMDDDDGQCNIYDIGGKYGVLTGTVCISKWSVGARHTGYIKIYGDDILLWEDNNITATTKPYNISVNISGVTDLKIEMCGRGNLGGSGIKVMLGNPTIQK